jgi:hypothetical protein
MVENVWRYGFCPFREQSLLHSFRQFNLPAWLGQFDLVPCGPGFDLRNYRLSGLQFVRECNFGATLPAVQFTRDHLRWDQVFCFRIRQTSKGLNFDFLSFAYRPCPNAFSVAFPC